MMRENGMRNTHGALIALTLLGIYYVFFNFDLAQATHTHPVENRLGKTASDTLLSYNQTVIVINGNQLVAYLASSSEQKSLGLSVMENLTEDHAMLFLFRNLGQHAFWMKDMKFSIDIMWIDSDHRVVHIEHSLTPCAADAKCSVYSPEVESL